MYSILYNCATHSYIYIYVYIYSTGGGHFPHIKKVIDDNLPDFNYSTSSLIERFNNYNMPITHTTTPTTSTATTATTNSNNILPHMKTNMYESSGNLFFRSLSNESFPRSDHYQDSSVVVINRYRHPTYLQTLQRLLPTFNAGYVHVLYICVVYCVCLCALYLAYIVYILFILYTPFFIYTAYVYGYL